MLPKIRLFGLISCLGLMSMACAPKIIYQQDAADHDQVIARADTLFELTMAELYDSVRRSTALASGGVLGREDLKQILDSVLCDTLTEVRAREIDLAEDYREHRMFRARYYQVLARKLVEEEIYGKVSADSLEIVDFYFDQSHLFELEDKVLLWHILVSPAAMKFGPDSVYYRSLSQEELALQAEEYARQLRRMLDMGISFEEVARQYSHDSFIGQRGGFVGWTKRGVYHHPFDSIAFAMPPGAVSQPYEDKDGWHIIKVADRVEEGLQPLDTIMYQSARATLLTQKANARGKEFIDSLWSDEPEIVYNEAILDTNIYLVDRQVWAAVINGTDTLDVNDLRGLEEGYRRENQVDNTTADMKKAMIGQLTERIVFVQAARALAIDTLPEVVRQHDIVRQSHARNVVRRGRSDPSWRPTDQEVATYYNEHLDEFTVEKPLRLQHIIVKDSGFGELLRDQSMAGVDFMELAMEYYPGEPEIRAALADLGWVAEHDVPPAVWKAGLITPAGETSHPMKSQYGYHIVKVLERRDQMGLARASQLITAKMQKQHAEEVFRAFRDDLYDRYEVSFPGKLSPIHLRPYDQRQ